MWYDYLMKKPSQNLTLVAPVVVMFTDWKVELLTYRLTSLSVLYQFFERGAVTGIEYLIEKMVLDGGVLIRMAGLIGRKTLN